MDSNTPTQTNPAPISRPKRPQAKRQYVPKTNNNTTTSDRPNTFQRKTPTSTGPRAENTDQTNVQPKPAQPKQHRVPVTKPKQPNNNIPEQPKSFRVTISDLDLGVTRELLQQTFETALKVKVARAYVILQGQKSTGKGWIEFANKDDALRASRMMNGYMISGKPITTTLVKQSNIQKQIKREKQRVVIKVIPHQAELDQVKAKYPQDFEIINDDVPVAFKVSVKPRDLDTFPYDLEKLLLKVTLPESYPIQHMEIDVMNAEDEVPLAIKRNISSQAEKRAQTAYGGKPQLLGVLNWISIGMEKLMVDQKAAQKFVQQIQRPQEPKVGIEIVYNFIGDPNAKKEHETKIETKPIAEPEVATVTSNNNNDNSAEHSDDESESEEEFDESDESDASDHVHEHQHEDDGLVNVSKEKQQQYPTTTAHKGTQVKLLNFEMKNVAIVKCYQMRLVVSCSRCRTRSELDLNANQAHNSACGQCHAGMSVTLRSEPMHMASSILGYLDLDGCEVFDGSPASYTVSCFECTTETQFKNVPVGRVVQEKSCLQCHTKLSLAFESYQFTKIRAAPAAKLSAQAIAERKAKKTKRASEGMVRGKPLPEDGACKHYKKSMRWLRFPCCGRAFPCDQCHDEQTDHKCDWAKRMICGTYTDVILRC
jgi:hypothetical protein